MKINFDFGKFNQEAKNRVMQAMGEALKLAKSEIESRTPEDTQTLVTSYEIMEPKEDERGFISGKVKNDTPYGIYVEFGIGGKRYNYNKPKGSIFYKGIGARMLTRTKDYNAEKFRKIFFNAVTGKR